MTQAYEDCIQIIHSVMVAHAESALYPWPDDFKKKNTDRTLSRIADTRIDFTELTREEAEKLFFAVFDKNEENPLYLIPLYFYPYMNPDQTLTSIMGREVKAATIDNDHRGGYLAYGVRFGNDVA